MESFFSGVWRCRDDDDDGMDDRKKETEREEGFYARADIIKNFFSRIIIITSTSSLCLGTSTSSPYL